MTITVWKIILKNTLRTQFIFVKEKALTKLLRWENTHQWLWSYYKQKCQEGDEESQKRAFIETAARLMRSDIKSQVSTVRNQYLSSDDLKLDSSLSFIPTSLLTALETLFVGKDRRCKVAAVGLAIIQAVRPRAVIATLQIWLAVQIQHLYRSKNIVDTLHKNSVHRTQKWSDLKKMQQIVWNLMS